MNKKKKQGKIDAKDRATKVRELLLKFKLNKNSHEPI